MWDQDQKRAKGLWVHQKARRALPSYVRVCWCLLQTFVPQGKGTHTHSSLYRWGCRPTPKTQGSGLFFVKLLSGQIFCGPCAPRLFTCGVGLQIRTKPDPSLLSVMCHSSCTYVLSGRSPLSFWGLCTQSGGPPTQFFNHGQ